jgi:DNA excision repair protein ERCC-1
VCVLSLRLRVLRIDASQSFARIATASSDRLSALPGFGAVKVRRMKEAFDRPFRAEPPSTVPAFDSHASQATPVPSGLYASNKGKEKAVPVREASPPWDVESIDSPSSTAPLLKDAAAVRQSRPPSPAWDIELDLNASPSPPPPARPPPPLASAGKRPASPVWDFELDLNPSDEEPDGPMHGRKRRRANDEEDSGELRTTTLLDS